MFPMDRKVLQRPITIEYDSRGKRTRKTLPDAIAARRFYAAKYKAGKNPAVIQVLASGMEVKVRVVPNGDLLR